MENNKYYHMERISDTMVSVTDNNGHLICLIPADKDTPINMTGGMEFVIAKYLNEKN